MFDGTKNICNRERQYEGSDLDLDHIGYVALRTSLSALLKLAATFPTSLSC
jgi:hypothetical protein